MSDTVDSQTLWSASLVERPVTWMYTVTPHGAFETARHEVEANKFETHKPLALACL